jgi:hypothetical protein
MMTAMGLDVYVGSLTRYTLGEWLTVVQQAGLDAGIEVQIARAVPGPDDAVTDPSEVRDAVLAWERCLLDSLGDNGDEWPDEADLPYWTDKPDWDGYGGLVLLAAYDEKPELAPGNRKRLLGRGAIADNPRAFGESRAVQAAAKAPVRYPTLLAGVEWWLPLSAGPAVFETARLTGQPTRMGRVDQLVNELRTLATRLGIADEDELRALRQAGPPPGEADANTVGRFGLASFLALALMAEQHRQPLLLDY